MSSLDTDDLHAQLLALRAENAALRAGSAPPVTAAAPARRRGFRWRSFASALCIVVAGILVPVSIVAAWARTELVSEEAFVATFAPLADDPGVQQLIIDEASAAVNEAIDIDSLTQDLFDGIASLDLSDRAQNALSLLQEPATAGLHNLVDTAVTRVVESDAFATVWQSALVASHRALVATAAGGTENGVVAIDDTGTLGIELGPIVEELKQRLVDQGFAFAASIPPVDRTIPIVQSDALLTVGTVYSIAVTVGWWLPVIALILFAVGIAAARRRSVAVVGTGVAIAVGSGVLALALSIGGAVLGLNAGSLGIPASTLDTFYLTVVGAMRDTAVVLLFLGIVIAIAGWLAGRSDSAARARAMSSSVAAGARRSLQRRGLDTGRLGVWLYRQRVLVRMLILTLSVILLFALRPLSIGDIVATVVLGLLVWLVAALLERSPDDPSTMPDVAERLDDSPDDSSGDGFPGHDELVGVTVTPAAANASGADGAAETAVYPSVDPITTEYDAIADPATEATPPAAAPAVAPPPPPTRPATEAATDAAAASVPPKKPRAPRAKP